MPWTKRRGFYVGVRAFLPPINFTMGLFVGKGDIKIALLFLALYLALQLAGDISYWFLVDDSNRTTRHKLEEKLGVK